MWAEQRKNRYSQSNYSFIIIIFIRIIVLYGHCLQRDRIDTVNHFYFLFETDPGLNRFAGKNSRAFPHGKINLIERCFEQKLFLSENLSFHCF